MCFLFYRQVRSVIDEYCRDNIDDNKVWMIFQYFATENHFTEPALAPNDKPVTNTALASDHSCTFFR